MSTRPRASLLIYALAALSVAAVVAAVLVVGPAPASQSQVTRTAVASRGVVQSTVSGTGNLEPASQLDLGFKTGGTVTSIDVHQGEQVVSGQLLATLDPQTAEVTLEQAKASLQSAEADLAREEETDGESSSGSDSPNASAAAAHSAPTTTTVNPPATTPTTTTSAPETTTAPSTTTTAPAPSTTTTTTTPSHAPAATKPATSTKGTTEKKETKTTTLSTATREANLASARAAVKSDRLTVQSDEQAVQDTKLYAPEDGTIASLSGQVGEVVSGSGTSRASSTASSSTSSDASATGASARGATSTTGASDTGSSSSTSFAVLTNLATMQLVVPLSESEVGDVHDGQIATVTVEALEGRKLAAHVSEVAILSTSNSGVVSYDVTFVLDQLTSGIKPGMSATAEVVVKQAEGVNVPSSAISADSVTIVSGAKRERRRVVTGLAGNSTTIVLSGLNAGETVLLPTTSTSSSKGISSLLKGLRGGGGGLGGALGGGGGGFPGAGGGAFRGGG
jgi:multidrug efflux pump subunit AcrA (membrane-fusion protein)